MNELVYLVIMYYIYRLHPIPSPFISYRVKPGNQTLLAGCLGSCILSFSLVSTAISLLAYMVWMNRLTFFVDFIRQVVRMPQELSVLFLGFNLFFSLLSFFELPDYRSSSWLYL